MKSFSDLFVCGCWQQSGSLGVTHVPLATNMPNLGADIQTEAARRRFGVSRVAPRNQPESWPEGAYVALCGWWWVLFLPPPGVRVVLIGMHLDPRWLRRVTEARWRRIRHLVNEQGFPMCCRDLATLEAARRHRVEAAFTGRVTQTLPAARPATRQGRYAVDHFADTPVRARASYQAQWQDGIGRTLASADFGTNGGAPLARPSLIPEASDTVLVTRTQYAGDGEPNETTAPDGTRTRWENDRLGRLVKLIENAPPSAGVQALAAPGSDHPSPRVTHYHYAPDGRLSRLIVSNPDTGDQVTEWRYGTTLEEDGIARSDLLKAKLYPLDLDATGQVIRQTTYTYDRQGQVTGSIDPNGTAHAYVLNKLGRVIHDRVTDLGAGIDAAVRRISLEFDPRGLLEKISSHNNATVGSGSIANQVTLAYNAFNQLIEDAQSHSGAVSGGTPKVSYTHANGSANTTRRLTISYPSGKIVNMSYGAANSANDRLSRLTGVALTGESDPLAEFTWMGAGRLVSLAMPQPGIALSYKHTTGEPIGDAGDPYSGYDRFGRTVNMRWYSSPLAPQEEPQYLSRIQYGYDRQNRRLWRQDLAAPAETMQDRFYGYDQLGQVTDSALGNLNINRTSIAGIPAQREAFDYDSIGNWKQYLRQTDGSTSLDQTRWHNKDNQLTALDTDSDGLAYDATGNMTACRPDKDGDWSKGYTIIWDAWNRIVQVKNAQTSATVATYAYDGLTRRVTSTVSGTVRHFYYDNQWKPVEERINASSNPERVYYWSTRPGHRDELLRRDRATSGGALNETLWCLMDYFDPIAVADSNGEIQERYTYSAFGLVSHLTPAFAPRSSSDFAWNFLFHGQFRDPETGWDNYGYRYYLPWLGRWPSRDPIGETGGVNLYALSENSPIDRVDWWGLAELCTPWITKKKEWLKTNQFETRYRRPYFWRLRNVLGLFPVTRIASAQAGIDLATTIDGFAQEASGSPEWVCEIFEREVAYCTQVKGCCNLITLQSSERERTIRCGERWIKRGPCSLPLV